MTPRYQLHRRGILLWEGTVQHGDRTVEVKVHLARVQHVKARDVSEFMLVSPHDPLCKAAGQATFEALNEASTQIQPVVLRMPQLPEDL